MKLHHVSEYSCKLGLLYTRERSYDLHLKRLNEIHDKRFQISQSPMLQMLQSNNMKKKSKTFAIKGKNKISKQEKRKEITKNNESLFERLVDISNRSFE